MAYIGQQPVVGRYILLDQISGGFNGTTSGFTMSTAGGVQGVKPGLAQNVLLSLGGVIQQPGVDYTISGSGITFTTPPVSGTTFFATVLGDAQSVGTPSDGTVTPASIASGFDFGFPNVNVTGVITIASGVAATPSLSITGDADTGLFSSAANSVGVSTSGTQRLVIDSSGHVGIGTSSPTRPLHLQNSDCRIRLTDSDAPSVSVELQNISGDGVFTTNGSSSLKFSPNNSESMRITSAGNVGIGTSSPAGTFGVDGAAFFGNQSSSGSTDGVLRIVESTSSVYLQAGTNTSTGSSAALVFSNINASNEWMRIDSSGRLGIGTSSPDTNSKAHIFDSSLSRQLLVQGDANDAAITINKSGQSFTFGVDASDSNKFKINTGNTVGAADHITINTSGSVGIGTTSPSGLLHLAASSEPSLHFEDTGSSNTLSRIFKTGSALAFNSRHTSAGQFIFNSENSGGTATERMRIDSSGRVGIGTTSPSSLLHLSGDQTALRIQRTSSLGFLYNVGTASNSATRLQAENGPLELFTNASQPIIFKINGDNEQARIDNNGRLGLGTNGPVRDFHNANGVCLTTGAAPQYRLNGGAGDSNDNDRAIFGLATSTNHFFSGAAAGDTVLRTTSGGNLMFGTGTDERMRITSDGRFLVGTTSTLSDGRMCFRGTFSSNRGLVLESTESSGEMIRFNTSSGNAGKIDSSGTSTTYGTSSDYRLKENVVDLVGAINRVKQLAPKRFNFLVDANTTVDGFLAHEAQTVVPEAVTGTHNEVDEKGNAVMQCIDQSKLVPLLTAALQEAIAKIETLETSNADLLARVTALES